MIRGEEISRAKISGYLKKAKLTEDQLLEFTPLPSQQPKHIRFEKTDNLLQTPLGAKSFLWPDWSPSLTSDATNSWQTVSPRVPSLDLGPGHTPSSFMSNRTSLTSLRSVESSASDDVADQIDQTYTALGQVGKQFDDNLVPDEEEEEVTDGNMADMFVAVSESEAFHDMAHQLRAPNSKILSGQNTRAYFRLISATPLVDFDTATRTANGEPDRMSGLDIEHNAHQTYSTPDHMSCFEQDDDVGHVVEEEYATDSSRFLSKCFATCILGGQGYNDKAHATMDMATRSFEHIVTKEPSQCLIILSVLLPVLESTGQRSVAKGILEAALKSSTKILGVSHPVVSTLDFMLDIVSGKSDISKYDLSKLEQTYQDAVRMWGPDAPSTLTTQYHVGWRLNCSSASSDKALEVLTDLRSKCEASLPRNHIQTVVCMMTMARALHHMKQPLEAATLMREAVDRLYGVYPWFHPYCLEARSRQAVLLTDLGGHDVEALLRTAVIAQAKILGPENRKTKSTLSRLRKVLRGQKRSQEAKELPKWLNHISVIETDEDDPLTAYQTFSDSPSV